MSTKAMADGQLPEWSESPYRRADENGWRVITAWDSDAQFQRFRDETLIPALR